MADRSNGLITEQLVIAPSTTVGVTGVFGQYAVGVLPFQGTFAITNLGGSFGNGFALQAGVLGLNTAGTFYVATSGSTGILHVLRTVQGVSLRF
jgi:hypothetical protein